MVWLDFFRLFLVVNIYLRERRGLVDVVRTCMYVVNHLLNMLLFPPSSLHEHGMLSWRWCAKNMHGAVEVQINDD